MNGETGGGLPRREKRPARRSVSFWPLAALALFAALFFNPAPWDNDRLLAGIPLNLVYHSGLCAAASAAMWAITRKAWPDYLDRGE